MRRNPRARSPLALFALSIVAVSCGKNREDGVKSPPPTPTVVTPTQATPTAKDDGSQWYRASLELGDKVPKLHFFLQLPEGGTGEATIVNGREEMTMQSVMDKGSLSLKADWNYESEISASVADDGSLSGQWRRYTPLWGEVTLRFHATPVERADPANRYAGAPSVASIAGSWDLRFEHHGQGRAQFEQSESVVTGFVRPGNLGDLRFLAGNLRGSELSLSTFNGNVATVIRADISKDGKTLTGGVMNMQTMWIETFTGKRVESLPPEEQVRLKEGATSFKLAALERYNGRPTMVVFFATWCSSCNDAFPFIMSLRDKYRGAGVELLGVVYDLNENEAETKKQMARFKKKYGIDFELVQVPTTPQTWAEAMPPELEGWDGLPIFAFVDKGGTVRQMWGGWYGPAAPAQNAHVRNQFDSWMQELVAL